MSLYDEDKKEIKKMIEDEIEQIPETEKEGTKRVLIAVVGLLIIMLMFFGTICFGIKQKTERKKYEFQVQTYGEEIKED